MRRGITKAVLAALAALATTADVGCGGAIPSPTAADAAWISAQGERTSLAALVKGRSLYVARCSGCHALRSPTPPPPEGWARAVAYMAPKARLGPSQVRLVVSYLQAASRPGRGSATPAVNARPTALPSGHARPPRGSAEDDARGWSTGL